MTDSTDTVKLLLEQTGDKQPQPVKRTVLLGTLTSEQKRMKLVDEEE